MAELVKGVYKMNNVINMMIDDVVKKYGFKCKETFRFYDLVMGYCRKEVDFIYLARAYKRLMNK